MCIRDSFNPIHKGHIALAEYAIEKGLCDEVVLVVSPQNPLTSGFWLNVNEFSYYLSQSLTTCTGVPEVLFLHR